jgi:hypothetical protein
MDISSPVPYITFKIRKITLYAYAVTITLYNMNIYTDYSNVITRIIKSA